MSVALHLTGRRPWRFVLWAISAGSILITVSIGLAQAPPMNPVEAESPHNHRALRPSSALDKASARLSVQAPVGPEQLLQTQANEHPLMPVLRWAKQQLPAIEGLQDYSATLVSRERIRGKLGMYQYMFIKVRHRPLSVYVRFLGPLSVEGQEVIHVAGQNQDNLLAHRNNFGVTAQLHPEGAIAMKDRHYPLTEIGIANLVRRLVDVGKQDARFGECKVTYFTGVKVDDRPCTVIEVVHPVPRNAFLFHLARIYLDDKLTLPIRYESYDWPAQPDGEPQLVEEYTYRNLKLNNQFTDKDFSIQNPEYRFERTTPELAQRRKPW